MNPPLAALTGAMLGLIAGSFLATIAIRWPQGRGVMRGRSHCDECGRVLGLADLVPLASWALARGRCRACGARIDPVHPFMELGCALIGGLAFLAGPPLPALLLALGGWLLLTLAVLDARHYWLPDALTLPFAALGLAGGEFLGLGPFRDRLIGAGVGYGALFLIALGYKRLRGREGLGLGDAKLLGGIGGWVGWAALPLVLLVASLAGLIWAVATGRVSGTARVPFGTFLCIAVWPAMIIAAAIGLQ